MSVPKLRFPEFHSLPGWSEKRLVEVCEINPSSENLPDSFIYIDLESVSSGSLLFKKKIQKADAPSRAQRLLKNGDVIYQMVRPYQRNNFLCNFTDVYDYVASTGYAQLRAFGSSVFLFQIIHTDDFVNKVLSKCTGSNYPAINSVGLADIRITIPKLPEQQKIADCLSSVDELIAAETQKLAALKSHKKGLMQQLFPAEGETLPKLRFPEFRDAGEWKEGKIGDLFSLKEKPDKATSFDNNKIITVKLYANGVIKNERTSALTGGANYFKRRAGQFIFSKIDLLNGAFGLVPDELDGYYSSSDVPAFSMKENGSSVFFLCWLKANYQNLRIERTGTSSTLKRVSPESFLGTSIFLPDIKEQQKIAACLASLDDLITAQTQKLAALKAHKKGLMQQLFPALDEVGA